MALGKVRCHGGGIKRKKWLVKIVIRPGIDRFWKKCQKKNGPGRRMWVKMFDGGRRLKGEEQRDCNRKNMLGRNNNTAGVKLWKKKQRDVQKGEVWKET